MRPCGPPCAWQAVATSIAPPRVVPAERLGADRQGDAPARAVLARVEAFGLQAVGNEVLVVLSASSGCVATWVRA